MSLFHASLLGDSEHTRRLLCPGVAGAPGHLSSSAFQWLPSPGLQPEPGQPPALSTWLSLFALLVSSLPDTGALRPRSCAVGQGAAVRSLPGARRLGFCSQHGPRHQVLCGLGQVTSPLWASFPQESRELVADIFVSLASGGISRDEKHLPFHTAQCRRSGG